MAGMAIRVPREITQGRMQIPVIEAGAIPRIQYSSGSAQALQQFSRDMFSLANGFQDQLDQTAAAEAESAGAVQGATGDFELQSYGTIRGRAYNKAAIETFVTTMETQSIFKVQELQARFGADPAKLEQELKAWGDGVAGQVEKVYAPAGAAFRQRLALRSAPAVEAARDARYKLTREQADAALIENEIALKAEISSLSGDLFSDNPARSEAAAAAVGALQREYLAVFDAVDPTTGKPLYNAEEKAKAKVGFYEDVMRNAALGWFDQQDDKAGAYVKFTEEGFTINLQSAPSVNLSPEIGGIIDAAAARYGVPSDALRTIAWIESKGKASAKNPRSSAGGLFQQIDANARQYGVGDRFDPVQSADGAARFMADNMLTLRQVLGRDPTTGELYLAHQQGPGGAAALLSRPNELAVNVVGYDAVRLNGGSPGMTAGAFAALWTKKANSIERKPAEKNSIDVRKTLPPEIMNGIESEMRARISFRNTLADRQAAADEKQLKTLQEATEFELTNRVFNDGALDPETNQPVAPLTREEITARTRAGMIEPQAGQRLIKLLETEKPDRSDPATFRDAERRMYAGENIYNFITENIDKFSKEDASSLLGRNQSMNVMEEGELSKDAAWYERSLNDLLTPDSMMAKVDDGAEERKFRALREFRRRVKDGEDPEIVSDELRERADRTFQTITNSKLDTLVRPAFSIAKDDGLLDLRASARALFKAFDDKRISADEFERQKRALKEWDDLQNVLVRQRKAAPK